MGKKKNSTKKTIEEIFAELKELSFNEKIKITITEMGQEKPLKELISLLPNIFGSKIVKGGLFTIKNRVNKLKINTLVPILSEQLNPGGTIFVYYLKSTNKLMLFANGLDAELSKDNAIYKYYDITSDLNIPEYIIFMGLFGDTFNENEILSLQHKYSNYLNLTKSGNSHMLKMTPVKYKEFITELGRSLSSPKYIKIIVREKNAFE